MKVARDYFSWSQYSLWQTSKKEFYKRYGLDEKSKSNRYFEKGKEFGHYKETGEIPHNVINPEMLEMVASRVDQLEIMEHELRVQIGDISLLSFADSGMSDFSEFLEYKTGKEPWTQNRVEIHEQLDFYATCYYIASGETKIPKCRLFWVETEEDKEGNISYTGLVEEFERQFKLEDIVSMMAKIITCKLEIEDWEYEELELEDAKVDRYIQLQKILKDAKEESDLIKLEILTTMEDQNVKYASTNRGSFTLSERKNWIYPKEINNLEKKYKDEIEGKKKLSQKSGEAKITVSTSLRFTLKK